jgi:hypothetical protein
MASAKGKPRAAPIATKAMAWTCVRLVMVLLPDEGDFGDSYPSCRICVVLQAMPARAPRHSSSGLVDSTLAFFPT